MNLAVYVGNEKDIDAKTPIAAALPQLTPEYVDAGLYCDETVLDLVRCCRQLLQDNAKLREWLKMEDAAPEHYPAGKMGHPAFTKITKSLTAPEEE